MTIQEICKTYGKTQTELCRRFGIPWRTMSDWYGGRRTPPAYVLAMMAELLEHDRQQAEN